MRMFSFFTLAKTTASSGESSFPIELVLICFALALLVSLIVCGIIFYTYKRKLKAPIYPLSHFANLNLTRKEDIFLRKNVVRTRISSDSRK